jgi:AAA ATPase-like protein
MTGTASGDTLGDLLAFRRRRRFVGRTSEVELFRVALESPEPQFLLLYIHGPPGIGKTTLLDVYAEIAAEAGASVVRLDGRDLVPSPQAVLQALGVPAVLEDERTIAGPPQDSRMVIMVDTYERLASLDEWVRTWLMPRLPATVLTVLAGRAAPDSAWRADPAWRELLRVVSLRNLSPGDSRQYLHACGVDPARFDQLVELAHGHPLGLSLLADVDVRGGDAAADPLTPDLVGTLLRRFVEIVPNEQHRRALEVCALARVTNRRSCERCSGRRMRTKRSPGYESCPLSKRDRKVRSRMIWLALPWMLICAGVTPTVIASCSAGSVATSTVAC